MATAPAAGAGAGFGPSSAPPLSADKVAELRKVFDLFDKVSARRLRRAAVSDVGVCIRLFLPVCVVVLCVCV